MDYSDYKRNPEGTLDIEPTDAGYGKMSGADTSMGKGIYNAMMQGEMDGYTMQAMEEQFGSMNRKEFRGENMKKLENLKANLLFYKQHNSNDKKGIKTLKDNIGKISQNLSLLDTYEKYQ